MVVDPVEADPTSVGMDPLVLERIDSVVLAALADSAAPGAALAVGRRGRLVRLRGYGRLDWGGEEEVTPTTLYDLASLTKVIGTTTAVMILEEEGRLDLEARVVEYLPWWDGGHTDKAEVTVRQLLLHRAGLPPFRRWFFEVSGEEAYREVIAAEPLEFDPGSRSTYSDIGVMTLAFIIEEVSGARLDTFLEERVWFPLGMTDTGFLPDPSLMPRIAPTEVDTVWRGVHVRGIVHDENADAIGGVAGHAGLFSTALDLSIFARALLGGGTLAPCEPRNGSGVPCGRGLEDPRLDSVRIVDPDILARYTRRYEETSSRALGWDTPSDRSSAGDFFTSRAFGHTGFTGTSIWIDPELDLFVILLTNRVNPTRDNSRHVPLRRVVHDLAAMAITDRPVPRRQGQER